MLLITVAGHTNEERPLIDEIDLICELDRVVLVLFLVFDVGRNCDYV